MSMAAPTMWQDGDWRDVAAAHRDRAPLLDDDLPPPALMPLDTFLREYDRHA